MYFINCLAVVCVLCLCCNFCLSGDKKANCLENLKFQFLIDSKGTKVDFDVKFEDSEEYEPREFTCHYKGKGISVGADSGYGAEDEKYFTANFNHMGSTYAVEPLLIEEPDESSVVNVINGVEYLVRKIKAHCSDSLSFTFTIDSKGTKVNFEVAFENSEEYEPGEFICHYKGKGITVGADPGYGAEKDKFFTAKFDYMGNSYAVEPMLIEEPDEFSILNVINGVEYLVTKKHD